MNDGYSQINRPKTEQLYVQKTFHKHQAQQAIIDYPYYQVLEYKGSDVNPCDYDWKVVNDKLAPTMTKSLIVQDNIMKFAKQDARIFHAISKTLNQMQYYCL